MKTSEPIKLRWKRIGGGRESAFLDINIAGRPRKKEYLRLYRGGDLPRAKSREAERLAAAICAKRLSDYNAARAGIRVMRTHRLLTEYYEECCSSPSLRESTRASWRSSLTRLRNYLERMHISAGTLIVGDIDGEWCRSYLRYLQNEAEPIAINRGKPVRCHQGISRARSDKHRLSPSTARQVFSKFKAMLAKAVTDGIIAYNPAVQVGRIKTERAHREYLDIGEVRRLMRTDFPHDVVCRAFLFSCLTGLRYSDIRNLDWSMVSRYDGHYRIDFSQQKTRGQMYLDISDLAFRYMGSGSGQVFKGLPLPPSCNAVLSRWMQDAGIQKHITFHCARHTAAVSLLTAGAEIYTVSKILGHSSLSVTQVYADIVDKKRSEAIDALAGILGDNEGTDNGQ